MWLGFAHVGVTDLPMTAAFAAAMLLGLGWIQTGAARRLPLAAALLALAVLAKGLVPLVLAVPLAWAGRRRIGDLLRPRVMGAFLLVALPWYLLCFLRNGTEFLQTFFWEHHFGRFASEALQHRQPFWFYAPVLIAALLPWTPALALLFQRRLYIDARCRFLGLWALFAFLFFSASTNKLPGYLLPVLPALAALAGVALDQARRARGLLAASAAALVAIPVLAHVLPEALAAGLSRSHPPPVEWTWLLPLLLAAAVWRWEARGLRGLAVAALAAGAAFGAVYLKITTFPALDQSVSARPLWRQIAGRRRQVCVAQMHRSWRYGLNYYSITPLPDCVQDPRPLQVVQPPGRPPAISAPAYAALTRRAPAL
jgi:4-amino-4-deoxy-L-arabinose transferase-like glycosyltransferase